MVRSVYIATVERDILSVPQGNSSNLGSTWTEANIQELYDLRLAKKSWTEIGATVNRTGGAAQQQWMRVSRELCWLNPLLTDSALDATRKPPGE